jgi:two-component system LytT family response regulator
MKIRTLIVDDEPLARQGLRLLARDTPDLEIIGECESGPDALVAMERDPPALVFLDVLAARQGAQPACPAEPYLTRLTIKTNDKVVVVKTAEIDSIESAGNYVAVNVGKESHILRETLNVLESQLDPEKFFRISRSAIVNLDRVKELQPMFKGEHVIVLQNGKRLAMTRGLRDVERALRFG